MEDKQLNINQPLLSVRRFSSITASKKNESRRTRNYLPTMRSVESCKTELNSDPMKNTGSVPFGWEHSPGRPKDETDKQIQTKENPPSLPKLPPGWVLKPKRKDSDNITEELMTEYESAKSAKKESSDSGNDEFDDDDNDTDEAFMDALDTLSRGESSFYNCSASGVSGFDSAVKSSGILSADPKIRDFMMGRFLPAAKAMASEVPQNTYRKNVVKEKPRDVKKMVNNDTKKAQLRYGPNFLQDIVQDNEEDEDSDYDYDEHGNISSKLCGFLPRFCLKGSVGHVNPVSGTRTANRTQASSSSISSFSETENEPARIGIYEHRSFDKPSVPETTNQNIYSRLQGCGISNEGSQSSVPERNNSSSTQKKHATSFKELLAYDDKNKNETDGSQDFLIEKTLYVDTVHMIKSHPKEQSKFRPNSDDTNMVNDDDESKDDVKMGMEIHMDQDPEEWIDDKNGDKDLKGSQDSVFELPAPPPLPKSPSDSWLWRTLPSKPSKNTAIWWNPKYPSSNAQLGHSEGPLLPIPES